MFEHPTSISGSYIEIALNVLFPLINEWLRRILRLSDADAWAGGGPRGAAAGGLGWEPLDLQEWV